MPSASTARRDRKPKRCKSRPQDDIGGALRNRGKTNAVKHWLHKTMSGAPRKRDETNAIRKRAKTRPQHDVGAALRERGNTSPTYVRR